MRAYSNDVELENIFIYSLPSHGTHLLGQQICKVRESNYQANNSTQIHGQILSSRSSQFGSQFRCSDLSRRLLFQGLNRLRGHPCPVAAGLSPDGAAEITAKRSSISKNGGMRFLVTALIASSALALPVLSAEPIPLVVVPFDAAWGSRRLPIQPAALLPPPPVPEANQDTESKTEPRHQGQRWCRGRC